MGSKLRLGLAFLAVVAGSHGAVASDQLRQSVARELPAYGFKDVDVSELSTTQLAHIRHLLHSNKSVAQIRGNVGAILGRSLVREGGLFSRRAK